MYEVVLGSGAAAVMGAGAFALRRKRLRDVSRDRLAEPFVKIEDKHRPQDSVLPGKRLWIPPLVIGAVWLVLGPILGVPLPFALALSLVAGILVMLVTGGRGYKASIDLEAQLAEGIDLIVGSLGAGASTLDAISTAARETRKPLAGMLDDVVGRIRYGDTPRLVFEDLAARVPLESFRLFAFTVLVHEETGGSLAPILSNVGRTIRDRIDLSRRVRSEATQSMASVVGILAITYAIAIVTWQVDPERMGSFLTDPVGAKVAAGAVFLQAIGLLCMSKMSRIRF